MSDSFLTNVAAFANATFPANGLKVALCLSLFSAWVVVLVFACLNLHTRQAHFRLWAVAWLCFSMSLAASMGLESRPDLSLLAIVGSACMCISALYIFWGNLHVMGRTRQSRELGLAMVFVVAWSYLAERIVQDRIWNTLAARVLLSLACAHTATLYLEYCKQHKGAILFTRSLLLWSLNLVVFSFYTSASPPVKTVGCLISALLALSIALSMILLALEQARERNDALLGEFKKAMAQRRLLEQEIGVSEQKYRQLFDSAGDAIFLVDLGSLQIVAANPMAEELSARKADQLIGTSLLDLCPKLRGRSQSLLENKKCVDELFGEAGEFQLARGQGEQVLCEGSAALMDCHQQPVFQINAREITGRKKMEQQLRQAEKLSALGQLVAGVAHELNNPLAVVMGYAQLLVKHKALDEKARNDLLKVLHESERAAKIVRNLLTFARPREPLLAMVDVNRLVVQALETREIQVQSANVKVVRRLASELPSTKADAGQIEQVLANLVVNAIQALDGHPGTRVIEVSTEQRGGKIRIGVADTGPGIPIQLLGRIFDPFFTTKGPGRGTGLGLSICYSIMEEHKGKIWVESELGKGSRFIVELPVVKGLDAVDRKNSDEPRREPGPEARQRRLLIVDDEPGIVDVLKEALSSRGYQTETACNGAEALTRLASQDYDLIISDLCMPEMSGEKLFAAIREKYPHLQEHIIFVTGDTVSPGSRSFLEGSGASWLSKPFNIGEIERLVDGHLRTDSVKTVCSEGSNQQPATAL
jgi:PAS domain S-box-containing protein